VDEPEQKWRQKFHAIIDFTKDCVENGALSNSYINHKLPKFLKGIVQKHGVNHVRLALATTINHASWDGRYYREVKAWAAKVEPFPQFPGHTGEPRDFHEFCINAHPVILNDLARLLMKLEKELARQDHKEPER
jgi:hypothetical protein